MNRSAEDGEIFDDDEMNVEPLDIRVKRRRDSHSSEDSQSYQRRGPMGSQREFERNHRINEGRRWVEHDINLGRHFRQPSSESIQSEGLGAPRAHSTAGAARNNNERHRRGLEAQTPMMQQGSGVMCNTNNNSRSVGSKMFKVEPFPKGVKPTDQYQEWTFWLANFEMAAEKAGTAEQRPKAIDLSLHIGEEIRRIIVAKGMLPRESLVELTYPFYDKLVNHLEEHFRGLTDESVDVASFNGLRQAEQETALEFELRLEQMAQRVNEKNEAMIRTRYIEGLRDKSIRERAFIDGISMKDVVKMATRKEAIATKAQAEFSPCGENSRAVIPVAAISGGRETQQANRPGSYRGSGLSRWQGSGKFPKGRFDDRRSAGYTNNSRKEEGGSAKAKGNQCKQCGVMEHRAGYCPAEKAPCFKCGAVGHFGRMCQRELRSVDGQDIKEHEVETEIYE